MKVAVAISTIRAIDWRVSTVRAVLGGDERGDGVLGQDLHEGDEAVETLDHRTGERRLGERRIEGRLAGGFGFDDQAGSVEQAGAVRLVAAG